MSDRSTGYRRVINLGNTNHNNSWTIKGLDLGQTYYWSVQALDNCFAGSDFAPENTISTGTTTFALSVAIGDGWNMVSVPGTNPARNGTSRLVVKSGRFGISNLLVAM